MQNWQWLVMGDFSYESSPDSDDSRVEDIISQASELSTLQQIVALNLSLAPDSTLPTHLESRFRKLKSFSPPPSQLKKQPNNASAAAAPNPNEIPKASTPSQKTSPLDCPDEAEILNISNEKIIKGLSPKPKSRSKSFSSPSASSTWSLEDSPSAAAASPPNKRTHICCFWSCTPKTKRPSRKKSMCNPGGCNGRDGVTFSDLSSGSLDDHQRRINKLLKEQEKIIQQETDKVLKWANHFSASFK